jgi:hypothetical protein
MAFSPGAAADIPPVPGEIDYRLTRQRLLAEYRAGQIARHEICDAHAELRRAAAHVGEPVGTMCPVCDEIPLVHVTYVFGPRLPSFGRCITSKQELARLAQRKGEHACYVVEVCAGCGWNHLIRAYVLSPARA